MILGFFRDFPPLVKSFLLRFLLLFIGFEAFLHTSEENFVLLNRPLTKFIAQQSTNLLEVIHPNDRFTYKLNLSTDWLDDELKLNYNQIVSRNNQPILLIADPCNGLELYALYLGFILAIPLGTFRLRLLFILLGTPFLVFANILRCMALIELQIALNQYFDFYHHFLFKAMMYGTIFCLWAVYIKFQKLES
jgi:exosortase/archaeosortase family protein